MAIRAVSDRSEWRIEATHDGWGEWFELDVWAAVLGGAPSPVPAEDEAAVLLELLDPIAAAGDDMPGRLRAAQAERARRLFG